MKNRFLKALLAIALCAVMILPLAACGEDNDGGGNNGGNPTPTGELQFDENGKVIFNNVTIRLETVVNGDDKDAFNSLVDTFNILNKGKIRVNYTNTPAASYESTVAQKINYNNNAPDLIMSHQKSHKNFQTNGLIQSLDGIMEKSGIQIDLSNYSDGLAQYSKLGTSNLYSVPADAQTMVVVYNKQVLTDLGKNVPTNRQELLDVCAAYKTKTGRPAIGWETGGDYYSNYVYITACLQNGAKLYDQNTLNVDWYSDEANRKSLQDASESIRELIVNGYAELAQSGSNNLTTFMNGNSLFYFTCPWSLSSLVSSYASSKGNISEATLLSDYLGGACTSGWFAMSDNAQKNYLFGDSHFFAMSKTCTDVNKQAAILEFINWFTTNASAGQQWARAGHVSASKVITASDEYKNDAYVTNFMDAFYPNIDNFVSIGVTTYYEPVINNLKSLFANTVTENTVKMSTADAYAKYATEIQAGQRDANGSMEDLL